MKVTPRKTKIYSGMDYTFDLGKYPMLMRTLSLHDDAHKEFVKCLEEVFFEALREGKKSNPSQLR